MKSITFKPNATIIMAFASVVERDAVSSVLSEALPREVHSKFRPGDSDHGATLAIRIQDLSHPVTIAFDGGTASVVAAPNVSSGTPANPFGRLPESEVPGANAERGTGEAPKTSGVNLTAGVPGAINNDPSTATNAAIEGSPAQAVASALGNKPAGGAPGGFPGPEKAAVITGTAPGATAPAPHLPKDEKPDQGAVNIQQRAEKEAADGEAAKARAAAKPVTPVKPASVANAPKPPLASKAPHPAPSVDKGAAEPAPAPETAKTGESSDKAALAESKAPL